MESDGLEIRRAKAELHKLPREKGCQGREMRYYPHALGSADGGSLNKQELAEGHWATAERCSRGRAV